MKKILFIFVSLLLFLSPMAVKADTVGDCIKAANQTRINAEQEAVNTAKSIRMDALREMIKDINVIRDDFDAKKEAALKIKDAAVQKAKAIDNYANTLKKLRKDFNAKIKPIQNNYVALIRMANKALKNNIASIKAQFEKDKAACSGTTAQTPDVKKELIISTVQTKNIRITQTIGSITSIIDIIIPDGYYSNTSMQKDPLAYLKARTEVSVTGTGAGVLSSEMIIINKKGYVVIGAGYDNTICTVTDFNSSNISSEINDFFNDLKELIDSGAFFDRSYLMEKYKSGMLKYRGEKPCGSSTCDVWQTIPLASINPHSSDVASLAYYIDNKSHIIKQLEMIPPEGPYVLSQIDFNIQMKDITAPTGPCMDISSYMNGVPK